MSQASEIAYLYAPPLACEAPILRFLVRSSWCHELLMPLFWPSEDAVRVTAQRQGL